jgi:Raf kinase inhibitor-like YbhB/YbcL family protein
MKIWSDSFTEGGMIPPECAFAVIDPRTHVRLSSNRNPHLAWDEVPAGTQSLVILCHRCRRRRPTAPTSTRKGVVPESLKRADFYHWALVDIPPSLKAIAEGQFSDMVTPHGKSGPNVSFLVKNGTEHQLRQGVNDYTSWFATDPDMAGEYFGYDGPCPPWNDERVHTYVFTIYALDIAEFPLDGSFTCAEAREALVGHILDEAQIFGVYSLNPDIAPRSPPDSTRPQYRRILDPHA